MLASVTTRANSVDSTRQSTPALADSKATRARNRSQTRADGAATEEIHVNLIQFADGVCMLQA